MLSGKHQLLLNFSTLLYRNLKKNMGTKIKYITLSFRQILKEYIHELFIYFYIVTSSTPSYSIMAYDL